MQITNAGDRNDPNQDERNTVSALCAALVVAVSLFLALHLPAELVAAAFRQLLFLAATVSAICAFGAGDRFFTDRFTRWDETALFAPLGLLSGVFIDADAVAAAYQAARAGGTG